MRLGYLPLVYVNRRIRWIISVLLLWTPSRPTHQIIFHPPLSIGATNIVSIMVFSASGLAY
jgi:hypothetical protein